MDYLSKNQKGKKVLKRQSTVGDAGSLLGEIRIDDTAIKQ